ncbi:MAG TPA: dethiobiotin synthase [Jatrophihabitans sp.]|jgi:dethiobiotin synthetase
MKTVVVTGTGTDVGKTIFTAALASNALAQGLRVAVVKPYQTGVGPDERGDLAMVERLTGIGDLHEYVRYAEPLAPGTAARRLGEDGLSVREAAERIHALADRDYVIVEGAGGLRVHLDAHGDDLTDLINALGDGVAVMLVAGAGLGTLNITALTARTLEKETGYGVDGVIVGAWPEHPDLAERCNLADLPRYAGNGYVQSPLAGVLPAGAGNLDGAKFAQLAAAALTPALGGHFDAQDFVDRNSAPLPEPQSKGL